MGWLRSVGSLELHISFAECCLFYRALLQKRLVILRSLLIEATPYETPLLTRTCSSRKSSLKRLVRAPCEESESR